LVDAIEWATAGALRGQFENLTGELADASFGAYVLCPLGSDLLIGLSNRPGNSAGAAVVRSENGSEFVIERVLDEQGVHDTHPQGSELWVPGTDPTDDWTLGNLYHRAGDGTWTKIRTMPNVIHSLGLWHASTHLYVAVGAHTGDNETWRGRVLRSSDGGTTWDQQVDVNDYRIYDVVGFGGRLYAIGLTAGFVQELYSSQDDGATWSVVADVIPAYRPRMVLWNGQLIVVGAFNVLYAIQSDHSIVEHAIGFTPTTSRYNIAVDGGDGYWYVLCGTGIYRSSDLATWQFYAAGNWISLARSGSNLIISEQGLDARLMQIAIG
jgi:hypothetical protein